MFILLQLQTGNDRDDLWISHESLVLEAQRCSMCSYFISRVAAAGKPVGLATNCAKHVLAELKADHLKRSSKHREGDLSRLVGLPQICWSQQDLEDVAQSSLLDLDLEDKPSNPELALQDRPGPDQSAPLPGIAGQLARVQDQVDDIQSALVRRKPVRTWEDRVSELQLGDGESDEDGQGQPLKKRRLNGWTVHLANMWKEMPQRAGESRENRRRRVLDHATGTWRETWFGPVSVCT